MAKSDKNKGRRPGKPAGDLPVGPANPNEPAWLKKTLPLPAGHQWTCAAGYNLFIADRGAVRFEFPEGWMSKPNPDDGSIGLHDREPPDDNVALRVSILRLPPGIPAAALATDLALPDMLRVAISNTDGKTAWDGQIRPYHKFDAEVVWAHSTFVDEPTGRPARSRTCLARARGVQPVITMDYWDDEAALREPIWDHVLATLRVAQMVTDLAGNSAN